MQSKANILIVEDEKIPAEFLKEILEMHGFNVVGISTKGADAIKTAIKLKPDVVFMDIMLKDNVSGSEAAVKISSSIETKIIFLTAHSDTEMIEYALDAGAINYLIKPYKEKQIIAALQIALNYNNTVIQKQEKQIKLQNGYSYEYENMSLVHLNEEVEIGLKSIKLIDYLCKNINRTISNEELLQHLYGTKQNASTLRALISRLNKTLGYALIQNNSKIGYKISSH